MARLTADEGLARLESFVSPYTGIVRGVYETLRAPDDARLALVGCRTASGEPTTASTFDLTAAGTHYRRDQAVAAAIGEALERYAGTCLPRSGVVEATAAELGPQAVAPARWTLFSEQQYAEDGFTFEPFTDQTRLRWVEGWSVPDGAPVYVPLQLAYMVALDRHLPGEGRIANGSSSGMALAFDRDEAVLRGLLELVERDAVMLTWACRLVHRRLDWSGTADLVARERRHFAPTGLTYHVLDASGLLGVPTALALMLETGVLPAGWTGVEPVLWGIGAASAPTMAEAWDKALRECFQTRSSLRVDLLARPERCLLDAAQVEDPEDHVWYYARAENQAKLAFLVGSDHTRDIAAVPAIDGHDPPTWIDAVARCLAAHGASAYAVDITPPDLADAGLHVVHVLSPELQPVDFPHRHRFLGGRRLYDAAYAAGMCERPLTPADLNPDPHPFP
ncbi:MAG: YcaO-like family protein [Acidimicrobiales bacterium]